MFAREEPLNANKQTHAGLVATVAASQNESRCSRARRGLPVSSPAHGRAGPSCRSRPPSGSSPPRPTGASCMTTGGCRATVVYDAHEVMALRDAWGRQFPSDHCSRLRGAHSTWCCVHRVRETIATARAVIPRLCAVSRARAHNAYMLSSKVIGRAGRRRGYE